MNVLISSTDKGRVFHKPADDDNAPACGADMQGPPRQKERRQVQGTKRPCRRCWPEGGPET